MKKILVPTDFTEAADNALSHAVSLAKVMDASVTAVHIVAKDSDHAAAQEQVAAQAAGVAEAHGLTVDGIVRTGNIFDDIGDTAVEVGAQLIIMGTHGMKGLQYITGSHALRVITDSEVPFIVVQKGSGHLSYEKIVLPIAINSETKQKIKFAKEIATLFASEVHIVYQDQSDSFLKQKLIANLKFTAQYLNEHRVRFTTKAVDGGNFATEVADYAAEINADLVAIMNLSDGHLLDLFGRSYEQILITNKAQIPVMVVNLKNAGAFSVSFGMG